MKTNLFNCLLFVLGLCISLKLWECPRPPEWPPGNLRDNKDIMYSYNKDIMYSE